jgi:hypothetical protein
VNTPATVVAVFEQFNLDTKYIPLLHLLAYQTKRYCSEALMNDRNLCNNPLFDTSFRKDFMNHFILQNADLIKTDDFNIIKALFTLAISIYSECYKITYIDNLDDKVS